MNLHLPSAPHTHAPDSVPRIMGLVLLAVAPATLYGLILFGWPALSLLLVTVLTCLLCEAACLSIAGRPVKPFLWDGSALLTGVLLAVSLPPWAPWWMHPWTACRRPARWHRNRRHNPRRVRDPPGRPKPSGLGVDGCVWTCSVPPYRRAHPVVRR